MNNTGAKRSTINRMTGLGVKHIWTEVAPVARYFEMIDARVAKAKATRQRRKQVTLAQRA